MNTMSSSYFYNKRNKYKSISKALCVIRKLLIVIGIYLAFGILLQQAYANSSANENTDPYLTKHGSVWLLPDNGIYLEALQIQTDVNYEINGPVARAKIKQQFKNNSGLWAEGIYVFPLPEKAAIDQYKMIIGERVIEGQIKERGLARRTYEKAKSDGKKTSLVEQQRPNVFTTKLANIAPGETVSVEFEYQQLLDYRDDGYQLRFPMVVGPRYNAVEHTASTNIEDIGIPDLTSVYTETHPLKKTLNPVHIHIMLDAGFNLAELKSPHHKIDIFQTSETRFSISTVGDNIYADRDFELIWKPELYDQPQLTAFNESTDGNSYTMVSLLPPDIDFAQQKIPARDVVFVLDISGSMSGTSIKQAKASLITALDGLSSVDRFNLIWFNDQAGSLFPKAVDASVEYKNYAKLYIEQLRADGGTEMLPALKLALSRQEEFSRFRQVIFLTDGNISNETELFNVIKNRLGNGRLFTIGIGSAPNSYFMRKAASHGRGTFTYISDINEVQKKTMALFKKLESPALINIHLELNSAENEKNQYEIFPSSIPDLYAGETLTLLIKGNNIPEHITLVGDYGNTEWQTNARLKPASKDGIRIAWAREKIESLMNTHHELHDASQRTEIQHQVTETALDHGLVSRYTSMVAVDVTPANDQGMLYKEQIKNNLPHGWQTASSSTGMMLAQTASSSRLNLLLAIALLVSGLLLYRWRYTGIKVNS